ncbi:MAG: DUF421 domain-containing protein [Firmicutes bacterium]|nr:DUF421 domain-containing protein [Bacillota bacterium]
MEVPIILTILWKTIFLFFITMLCFRIMGYRTLGDMEPMDYVIVLGVGEIMGSPLSSPDRNVIYPAIAIFALTMIQLGLSALYARSPKINRIMEGTPIPVIRNGRILHKNLIKNRIDINTIREELRVKGVRSEKDVDSAFLEPSGRFSVILKNEASPITPRYLGEKGSLILVENGEVRVEDWNECDVSQEEVLAFLKEENIDTWEEIDTLLYKNGAFILEKKKF